jgi:hypothetical protein
LVQIEFETHVRTGQYANGGALKYVDDKLYVSISKTKDDYWVVTSKPTTKERAEEMARLVTPMRGEVNDVKTVGQVKAHSKVIYANGGAFAPNISNGTQFMNGVYADGGDVLPPTKIYGENIYEAMNKFKISDSEARKKYGQFTINQWNDLLSKKTNNKVVSLNSKKYIDHDDIEKVNVIYKGKEVSFKGEDVLNGANILADGGDLSKIAFYIPKRDVINVTLKDGNKIKPANGYWIKKGSQPILASSTTTKKTSTSGARFKFDIGDKVIIDDSGYVTSFSEFDLSKPAEIIDRSTSKMGGKTYYFYKVKMANGRVAFNQVEQSKLSLAEKGSFANGGNLMDVHNGTAFMNNPIYAEDGTMLDTNDGFMRMDNENNYRYPKRPVHIDTIDEPIDLTYKVTEKSNDVSLNPINQDIDLNSDGRIRAKMTQFNRGSVEDFAKINPNSFEYLPMPKS